MGGENVLYRRSSYTALIDTCSFNDVGTQVNISAETCVSQSAGEVVALCQKNESMVCDVASTSQPVDVQHNLDSKGKGKGKPPGPPPKSRPNGLPRSLPKWNGPTPPSDLKAARV